MIFLRETHLTKTATDAKWKEIFIKHFFLNERKIMFLTYICTRWNRAIREKNDRIKINTARDKDMTVLQNCEIIIINPTISRSLAPELNLLGRILCDYPARFFRKIFTTNQLCIYMYIRDHHFSPRNYYCHSPQLTILDVTDFFLS